jgi:carbon-monoxide dehydrogenase medium subunit
MGTIGGNNSMAGPSQDTPPVLLVLEARLKLLSAEGTRIVSIEEFFKAPFKTVLRDAELLTHVAIPPLPARSAGCYHWLTKISTVDETLVSAAVLMALDESEDVCTHIRIALSSVAPTAVRARKAEEVLLGHKIDDKLAEQAAQLAAEETRPRSRADHRRKMTKVLVGRAIHDAWQKIG